MTALATKLKVEKVGYPIGVTRVLVWLMAAGGLGLMIYRWVVGLGMTTNLTNERGWGLWISLDLLTGVAVSAGGFTLAALVYIFNMERFHHLIRPTLLTAFIGYLLASLTLLADLGQPQRIWHLLRYANIHSPLFEIGWCVMAYTTVLALEFSPPVFERLGWKVPLRWVRRFMIPLVIAGIILSTMHQSTLGTMFTIFPNRIHPLWYSPLQPLYFYISAIAGGLAMMVFETMHSADAYGYRFPQKTIGSLTRAIPWVLGLYLIIKVGELLLTGEYTLLMTVSWPMIFFVTEMVVGVIGPLLIFAAPGTRHNKYMMFWGAVLQLIGLGLNRFNVSLHFLAGGSYIPSWMELAISIGMICIGLTLYDAAVRLFPVLPPSTRLVRR